MKIYELPRPLPGASIPTFLNLAAIGLLAGLSFCAQLGLVPMLARLDDDTYLKVMRGIIPSLTHSAVPLMFMGLGTFLVRLLLHRPVCQGARYWLAASFAFFIAGAAITVIGNFPINAQLMNWSPQNDPAAFEALRLEWNHLNLGRFAVAQLSFLTALVPLVFGRYAGRALPGTKFEKITVTDAPVFVG
jgi:uncharacterized membrane protein